MKKIFLILILLISLFGCKSNSSIDVKSKTFYSYFDTVCAISSYANDSDKIFEENVKKVESIMNKYHKLFDTFEDHTDINGLYKLNENAGISSIEVDDELMEFLLFAKDMNTLTNGAVNVMMGSVTSIWKKAISDKKSPENTDIKDASIHTSIDSLILDKENNTAYINDEYARIDVGALAKGYVCQKIKEELGDILNGYTLDLGGNILIIGQKANDNNFNVGIQNPFDTSAIILKYELADTSIVTSGNYERYFEVNSVKYCHIVDPITFYPSFRYASVTIIYEDSSICDALSTALFSLDIDSGKDILSNFDGIKAVWIDLDGNITEY